MNRRSYRIQTIPWEEAAERLRSLREVVFVSELDGPPGLIADALDSTPDTVHVLAMDEGGQPVGAGRIVRDVDIAWISRMAVLGDWRTQGVGHAILSVLLSSAAGWTVTAVHLNAPTTARRFYARHGFREVGPEFRHGGKPHVEMRLSME